MVSIDTDSWNRLGAEKETEVGGQKQERQYIHISFDDVYQCIRDITVNADSLQSLFAHKFFGWLKEMHEKYGAVFSLYTFNTDSHAPDYDISGFPTRYAQELAENAGWLKFGFHARDDEKRYEKEETEGIRRDYEKFIAAIRKASGCHGDCIDRVTRLGFFAGSQENIRVLRECEWGPVDISPRTIVRIAVLTILMKS